MSFVDVFEALMDSDNEAGFPARWSQPVGAGAAAPGRPVAHPEVLAAAPELIAVLSSPAPGSGTPAAAPESPARAATPAPPTPAAAPESPEPPTPQLADVIVVESSDEGGESSQVRSVRSVQSSGRPQRTHAQPTQVRSGRSSSHVGAALPCRRTTNADFLLFVPRRIRRGVDKALSRRGQAPSRVHDTDDDWSSDGRGDSPARACFSNIDECATDATIIFEPLLHLHSTQELVARLDVLAASARFHYVGVSRCVKERWRKHRRTAWPSWRVMHCVAFLGSGIAVLESEIITYMKTRSAFRDRNANLALKGGGRFRAEAAGYLYILLAGIWDSTSAQPCTEGGDDACKRRR